MRGLKRDQTASVVTNKHNRRFNAPLDRTTQQCWFAHLLGHGLSYPCYSGGYDLETRASSIETMFTL